MKKIITSMLLVAAVATAGTAAAEEGRQRGWYAGGFLGTTFLRDTRVADEVNLEFNTGAAIGGFGGYDFGGIRLEGELSGRAAEVKRIDYEGERQRARGTMGAGALMANVWFDARTTTPITPYVGGGIGFGTVSTDDVHSRYGYTDGLELRDSDDDVFAYQFGGGLGIRLSNRVTLDLGYRFFGTSNPRLYDTKTSFRSHNANVGARVYF